MQTCRQCGAREPAAAFYSARSPLCKKCAVAVKADRYSRRKAGLLPTTEVIEALCPDCNETKLRDAFGVDHSRPSGMRLYCKPCAFNRTRAYKYGLALDDYKKMVADQDGRCAVCGERSPLVVDHDHVDGHVRGLLCDPCNVGLGRFKDNPDSLIAAAAYLLKNLRPSNQGAE